MAPTSRYAVDSYAITAEHLAIMLGSQPQSRTTGSLAKFTLRATPVESGGAVFIGVGPQSDVDAYLDGVPHSELTQVRVDPFRPSYREATGVNKPTPPGRQDFWAISSQGTGTQEVTADLRTGNWAVVIMNADGTPRWRLT